MNDLTQFAVHAPLMPDWYAKQGKPRPIAEIPGWQASEIAGPQLSKADNEKRIRLEYQDALQALNKGYPQAIKDHMLERLASWPWWYARLVLDACPASERERADASRLGALVESDAGWAAWYNGLVGGARPTSAPTEDSSSRSGTESDPATEAEGAT